jgi:glycine cleavage system H protein
VKIRHDRRYSKDHEWVMLSSTIARIGLTDYAQDALGDVVFVQLPRIGDRFESGEYCGEIESSKSVSDLHCPISGIITNTNLLLTENPGSLNSDPYGDGWLFELLVESDEALGELLDFDQYQRLIEG